VTLTLAELVAAGFGLGFVVLIVQWGGTVVFRVFARFLGL